MNLASMADGDFFNWKMNAGFLFLLILAMVYKYDIKRFE
jgi:hypothetical protein